MNLKACRQAPGKIVRVFFPATLTMLVSGVFWVHSPALPEESQPTRSFSHYVTMRDGVRLAVDVNLPTDEPEQTARPALLEITRYGRSREDARTGAPIPSLSPLDLHFLDHGYAVVKVDARGSGASFGTRPVEYGPEEVRDGAELIEWVIRQPWSNGVVGAYGASYSGTTAELLASSHHPALKAVMIGWSDFDPYESPVRPYGLLASAFIERWSRIVGLLDRNDTQALGSSIRRVDEDADGSLLGRALQEHEANPNVFETVKAAEFKDDELSGGYNWNHASTLWWRRQIERSGVPMLVFASWFDSANARGALLRFRHYRNKQYLIVQASSHGGANNASPYAVSTTPLPPDPRPREFHGMCVAFFDRYLKGADNAVNAWPALRFWNLGEEAWRESSSWPPAQTTPLTLHLAEDASLSNQPPERRTGADVYRVDPAVTTGPNNRWTTQMGSPVLGLDDRGDMDARMLSYTSAPLEEDLQIAGSPTLTLYMSSDAEDGMVLAYLEDVDEGGQSRYVTEGGLRLLHRKTGRNRHFPDDAPYHSFLRADARPMKPGQVEPVYLQLQPVSVLIRRGHRVRLSIAGADAGLFDPIPANGAATLTVRRNAKAKSMLVLPTIKGGFRK